MPEPDLRAVDVVDDGEPPALARAALAGAVG